MIPYGRQDITQSDIDAVIDVLGSNFLTQGPAVPKFEKMVATYTGAKHAVAVNSATSALHIACLAMGLGKGDWLWTSPISFVASSNCALYCGAKVDFVDIDPRTYNMCVKSLEQKLLEAERVGRLPKIIVPVALCGQSCDMLAIKKLSEKYGFRILEDASHAVGGKYQQEPVGSGNWSDVSVFSFHPVKIITTAEGGVATTNDIHLAEKMALLRSHGITKDSAHFRCEPPGPWYYEQIDLGYNYRMTDIQAALGISQLSRLDDYVERRNRIAERYDLILADHRLQLPYQIPDAYSSRHLYVALLDDSKAEQKHRHVFESMHQKDINVNLHYIPIHTQPFYRNMGFCDGMFPVAENYYQRAITIPLFPTLTKEQQDYIALSLKQAINL